MRLCYFGGYDRDHPRNRVLISGLRRCGADVIECHSRHPIKAVRALSLVARYWRLGRDPDVIVVGAGGHRYTPLAWLLARLTRTPLVFDAFVSEFETTGEPSPGGGCGRLRRGAAFALDRISAGLADVVLVDTEEHASYFAETLRLPAAKVRSVPVGADPTMFPPRRRRLSPPLRVLFAASFLPLHGVDLVVRAVEMLGADADIVVDVVGGGEERRRLASACRSAQAVFGPPVPYTQYATMLSRADVALGAFGATAKAARVIPCKVWDALAAGVPVVTADTPAVRRLLHDGHNAILVAPGDARALADALVRLRNDGPLRERLARGGRRTLEAVGTPEIVGRTLLAACAALGGQRRATARTRSSEAPGAS